jgi:hypothetical protein
MPRQSPTHRQGSFWLTPKQSIAFPFNTHKAIVLPKSNRGLAHSIFNLTGRGWTTRFFWRSSVSAAAKVKILCNIGSGPD